VKYESEWKLAERAIVPLKDVVGSADRETTIVGVVTGVIVGDFEGARVGRLVGTAVGKGVAAFGVGLGLGLGLRVGPFADADLENAGGNRGGFCVGIGSLPVGDDFG
jgi:hypothetical protein